MGKIHLKYLLSVSLLVTPFKVLATAYTFPGDFVPGTTELSASGDSLTNTSNIDNDPTGVSMTNTSGTTTLTNTAGTITASTDAVSGTGAGTKTVNLNGGTITGDISNATGTMNVTFGGGTTTTFAGDFDSVSSISVAADSTVDFTTATSVGTQIAASGTGAGLRFTGSSRAVNFSEAIAILDFASVFVDENITLNFASSYGIRSEAYAQNLNISGEGNILGTRSVIHSFKCEDFSNSANISGERDVVGLNNFVGSNNGVNSGSITSTGTGAAALYLDNFLSGGTFTNSGTITANNGTSEGALNFSSVSTFNNTGSIISTNTNPSVYLNNSNGTQIFVNSGTISSLGTAILGAGAGTKTVNLNGGAVTGLIVKDSGFTTMNITFGGGTTTTFSGAIDGVDTVTVSSSATVIHPNTGIPIDYVSSGTFANSGGTIGASGITSIALRNNSSGTVNFNLNGGVIYGDIQKNSTGTTNVTFGGSTTTTFDGDINGVDNVTVSSGATVIHPNTGIPINYASAGTFANSAGTIGVSGITTTALQNNSTGTVAFNLNGGTIYGDIKKNSSGTTNVTFGGSTTTTFAGEFDSVDSVSVASSSTVDFTTATSITSSLDATGSGAGVRFTGSSRTVSMSSNKLNDFSSVFVDEGITLSGGFALIYNDAANINLTISGSGTILGSTSSMIGLLNSYNGVFSNSATLQATSQVVYINGGTGGTNTGTIISTGAMSDSWRINSSSTGIYNNSGTILASDGNNTYGALSFFSTNGVFNNTGTITSTNSSKAVQLANTSGTSEFNNTGTISSLGNAISGENAGTKTVNLNGGTVTGDIVNATGTMNLTFGNSATTVFTGAMTGVNTLTVSSGAIAKFTNSTATHTISGSTVSIPGTLDLTATTSGTTTQLPSIIATSANPDFSGNLIIRSIVYLYPGTFTIINGNASGTAPTVTSPTNPHITLSATESSGDIILTITRPGYDKLTKSNTTKNIAAVLETIAYGSPTAAQQALLNAVDTSSNLDDALLQIIPDTAPNHEAEVIQNYGIQKVQTRIAELNKMRMGYVAGVPERSKNAWIKFLGNSTSQNTDINIAGYNSRTGGVAFGFDYDYNYASSLGIAAAYSITTSRQKANTNSNTQTKGYQGILYGTHQVSRFLDYLSWILSAGRQDYAGHRMINIGSLDSSAESQYKGGQYSAKLILGETIKLTDNLVIHPELSAQITRWTSNGYTETGNSGLNLTVRQYSNSKYEVGAGGRVVLVGDSTDLYKEFELRGMVYFNTVNSLESADNRRTMRTNVNLEGFSSAIAVNSRPQPWGMRLGASVVFAATERLDFKVSYDLNAQTGYRSHSGGLEFRYWL